MVYYYDILIVEKAVNCWKIGNITRYLIFKLFCKNAKKIIFMSNKQV